MVAVPRRAARSDERRRFYSQEPPWNPNRRSDRAPL